MRRRFPFLSLTQLKINHSQIFITLKKMQQAHTLFNYFELGFLHVIPLGFDHILFIVSLFFLQSNLKKLLLQCSVFTLAHSISLGMAATGCIIPNPEIIEPFIAITILITSLENILLTQINRWNLLLIGAFGWIHGMGFATAISEQGFPKNTFISSLFCFNLGVELAQIMILILLYFLISKPFGKMIWYRERIVLPISSMSACIAIYWTIERIAHF